MAGACRKPVVLGCGKESRRPAQSDEEVPELLRELCARACFNDGEERGALRAADAEIESMFNKAARAILGGKRS